MTEFAINDRAANYGDGLFSTMKVQRQQVALYERHIARLLHDACRLGLTIDEQSLRREILEQAKQLAEGTLKVLISAGEGGRGYARTHLNRPGLHCSFSPLPDYYSGWQSNGITVGLSNIALARQPLLGGLKHTNRLEQVLIKQAIPDDVDDVLVCDEQGCLVEASAANVFWQAGNRWYTPQINQCGVAGVMRSFVIDQLSGDNMAFEVGRYNLQSLQHAKCVFICNALMQIVPVHTLRLAHNTLRFSVAPVTQMWHKWQAAYQGEYGSL